MTEEQIFKPAQIFSSNMVLQQKKPIVVWGSGKNGTIVTASIGIHWADCKVSNGKWQLEMPRMDAGGPYEMRISDGEKEYSYENVMIGEVWYAGGQSNMELELQNARDGEHEVAKANNPNIRFYNVAKIPTLELKDLEEEATRSWQVVSPETAATMSAVGYYYACELSKELQVAIGIIDCYWGGTSISCWMSKEYVNEDEISRQYITKWDEMVGDKTDEQYEQEMEEYQKILKTWETRCEEVQRVHPNISNEDLVSQIGDYPWPPPYGKKSQFRPAGLYYTMVQRVIPYTIRGFLWYQGEEDEKQPDIYDHMLFKLIRQWRNDWKDDSLPFIIMQLPMFIAHNAEDTKSWAIIRQKQQEVVKAVKNTYLTVLIDCGEYDNIHPLDKKTVGYRSAQISLENVYNVKNLCANSPIYKSRDLKKDKIVLYFDHVYGGFQISNGNTVNLFEIAGEDGLFVEALVNIVGETIEVSNKLISYPKYARYGWTNYGIVNLYNAKGLPVAPFVTK